MTGLQDMTFEPPVTGRVPVCEDHGPDCIGHAWKVDES